MMPTFRRHLLCTATKKAEKCPESSEEEGEPTAEKVDEAAVKEGGDQEAQGDDTAAVQEAGDKEGEGEVLYEVLAKVSITSGRVSPRPYSA
jgi:hypothetical protein